jgi:F0F1-type ATP synthase assembly protein I
VILNYIAAVLAGVVIGVLLDRIYLAFLMRD